LQLLQSKLHLTSNSYSTTRADNEACLVAAL
jgi:hypothetical protein